MDYSFPGILQTAGQVGMEGYVPATAQNNMQGYGNYMTQLTNNNGQGGQGAGYQFNDPSFEAYQAEQMKAEQAEQERQETIANIKSQISELEQRIATNTSKLKEMQTGNAVADEIASLEGDKFGFRFNRQMNNDPTSLFRWAQGRKDTQAANKQIKDEAKKNFANTVTMLKNKRITDDRGNLEMQLNNIDSSIRDGMNIGADVSELVQLKKVIEDKLEGRDSSGTTESKWSGTAKEQANADATDFLNQKPNSQQIKNYLDKYGDSITDNNTKIKLNEAYHEAVRKEKAKAEAKAFQDYRSQWQKANGIPDSEMVYFEDDIKKAYKNRGK